MGMLQRGSKLSGEICTEFSVAKFVLKEGTMCITRSNRKTFIQISDRDAELSRGRSRRQMSTQTARMLPSQIAEKRSLTAAADTDEKA
jgi:hypothetical protein